MELMREIQYDTDGEPMLVLRRKRLFNSTIILQPGTQQVYAIRLNDAWQFSEDHYPAMTDCLLGFDRSGYPVMERRWLQFDQFMFFKTMELCEVFGLGEPTSRRMANIATLIQEGIDDLIKTKPQQKAMVSIGEIKLTESDLRGQGSRSFTKDLLIDLPVSTRAQ